MTKYKGHHALPDIDPSVALAQAAQWESESRFLAGDGFSAGPLQQAQQEPAPAASSPRRRLAALFKSIFCLRSRTINPSEGAPARSDV